MQARFERIPDHARYTQPDKEFRGLAVRRAHDVQWSRALVSHVDIEQRSEFTDDPCRSGDARTSRRRSGGHGGRVVETGPRDDDPVDGPFHPTGKRALDALGQFVAEGS